MVANVEIVLLGSAVVLALGAIEERYADVGVRALCATALVAVTGIGLKLLHLGITNNVANFLALDAGALLGIVVIDVLKRRFPPIDQ